MKIGLAACRWLYTPANAMPVCFAAGLLLPSNAAWSTFFYIVGWPTIIWRLYKGWRPDVSNRAAMAMLALWGWSSLAIIWESNNSHHGDGRGYWLANTISTGALLLGVLMAARDEPKTRERIISVMIWCGATAATLSILLRFVLHIWQGRLGGWGALNLAVLGAAVVVVCIFLTLGRLGEGRWGYLVALIPLLVYLPLNDSRTAIVALICGGAVIATNSRKAFLYLILAGLGVLMIGVITYNLHFAWVDAAIRNAVARGSDCHIRIWRTAWGLFLQRPVFGFGPSARLPILPEGACPAYPSPHNLYLSLLVYSGIIGFALFWLSEALVLKHLLWRTSALSMRVGLAVMLVPLITGLTDLTQVIKGPSPLWYIIWLPLLLVVSLPDAGPESPDMSPTSRRSPPRA